MIELGGAGYVIHALGINSALVVGASLLGISILILVRMRATAPKLVVEMAEAAV